MADDFWMISWQFDCSLKKPWEKKSSFVVYLASGLVALVSGNSIILKTRGGLLTNYDAGAYMVKILEPF